MNPESPTDPRQALEASLTALVLGELPADQAEFLRRAIAQDAELAKTHERLRQTIDLVRETEKTPTQEPAATPEPLKLSEDRRQELLQTFKTVTPREFAEAPARQFRWVVPVGIAAVLLLFLGGAFLPVLSRAKHKGQASYALSAPSAASEEMAGRDLRRRSLPLTQERLQPAPHIAPLATEVALQVPKTTIVLPKSADETKSMEVVAANKYYGGFAVQGTPKVQAEWHGYDSDGPLRMFDSVSTLSAGKTLGELVNHPAVSVVSAPTQDASASTEGGRAGEQAGVFYRLSAAGAGGIGGGAGGGKPTSLPAAGYPSVGTGGGRPQNAPAPAARSGEAGSMKMRYGVAPGAETADRSKIQELAKATAPIDSKGAIDPATGLPVSTGMQVASVDPATGLAVSAGTPVTGAEGRQAGDAATRARGQLVLGDVPAVGQLFRSKGTAVSPLGPAYKAYKDAEQATSTKQVLVEARLLEASVRPSLALQEKAAEAETVARDRAFQEQAVAQAAPTREGAGKQESGLGLAGVSILTNSAGYVNQPVASSAYGHYLQSPKTGDSGQTYSEEKRKLDELTHFRNMLQAKLEAESTDLKLPKSGGVEIIDRADADSATAPSLGVRLRRAFTGEVEKKARVKVENAPSDIAVLANDKAPVGAFYPYFALTEQEVINSEAVLVRVVDDLKLDEAWGRKDGRSQSLSKAEAVNRLKSMLDVKPVPNSSLIDIGVKSDQPGDAAKLANAIAERYRDYRIEERKRISMNGIEALGKRLSDTDKRIALEKEKLARLEQKVEPKQGDEAPRKTVVPAPVPQPEVDTRENAFSTFSLNVSDVSFKTAAASLEKGVMPEPASIRTEEFINAFDYRDPEPAPGMPVGFCWDRSRYPFAQNRDVLRFSIKTAAQGRQSGRPLNLVLLLDSSGSMERADRIRIIREALKVLTAQLQPQDKLSVVTFARTAQLRVDGVRGDQAAQPLDELSGLTPEGGTNLEEAMNLAYQTALKHYLASGINRVVLLTDGAANLGDVSPENLKKKVEDHRKQGIAFDCFGIGWEGYNDDLLEVLSRNGDGRYGFINAPDEASTEFAAQLAGALHVAASDVKVQVEFNPQRVTAWRQIGYAKHQLTKEQFRDNTVDAAEIGAAESGNALYVVEVNPRGEGALATVRVRFKIPGTSDYREHEWAVPYNGSAAPLEQSSPALRLATSASAFSEWLAQNPYAAEVTPDALLAYLAGVPEIYGADPRPKKLEWMMRQAKSIAAK